jgi:hypothetical protein
MNPTVAPNSRRSVGRMSGTVPGTSWSETRGESAAKRRCDLRCRVAIRTRLISLAERNDEGQSPLHRAIDLQLPVRGMEPFVKHRPASLEGGLSRNDASRTMLPFLVRKRPEPRRRASPAHGSDAQHVDEPQLRSVRATRKVRHLVKGVAGIAAAHDDEPRRAPAALYALGGGDAQSTRGSSAASKIRRRRAERPTGTGESPCPPPSRKSVGHASNIRWRWLLETWMGSATSRGNTSLAAPAGRSGSTPFPTRSRVRDPRGLFPVHVAAAAALNGVHIDVVYRLARACPEALLKLDRRPHVQKKDLCARRPSPQGSSAVVRDNDDLDDDDGGDDGPGFEQKRRHITTAGMP